MTLETSIKKSIKEYLTLMHVDWFYNLQALGSYSGIPDLCFFDSYANKVVFVEVKTPKGKQSERQEQFQEMVERNNMIYMVVTDLEDIIKYVTQYN